MIRLALALRPVLLLAAGIAVVDSGYAADLAQRLVRESMSEHCCVAPTGTGRVQELTTHLNEVHAVVRRAADAGGIGLPPG